MKKEIFFILVFVFVFSLQSVLAQKIDVKKIDKVSVIIAELDNPAVFDFIINNTGEEDLVEIYSLISVNIEPRGLFTLPSGITEMEVMFFPDERLRKNIGFFTFQYEIQGKNLGIFKDNILIKIVPLRDVIKIESESIKLGDSSANLIIKNLENIYLENLKLEIDSPFFSSEKNISLVPFENVSIPLEINKQINELKGGSYILSAEIQLEDAKTKIESVINYLEEEQISTQKIQEGFIIRKTTIEKKNEGNIPATATIEIKKDIISRLFTINSPEPLKVERLGLFVAYQWQKDLQPTESLVVTTATNYTFPFILIILIFIIALFVKIYIQTAITLTKKVSFVKTKGGEFALKVNLYVKARRHADNVQIIDSLPAMTKLYEKFGRTPDKIDHSTKRLFWNIERLSKGEERVFSYIIYSRMNVVGRFELPAATAIFQHGGKTVEVFSNRAFFAAETRED